MPLSCIKIRGAKQHHLKSIDVDIPHHQLTVITGLSGSGKSTLAFDTLYAEGQRRYVETFAPYTRQFLERMEKPDVDHVEGLPPAIAIEQSNSVRTSRSSVGTMTEIADHLKLLFPRISKLKSKVTGRLIKPWTTQEIGADILSVWKEEWVLIGFEVPFPPRTSRREAAAFLQREGFLRLWTGSEAVRIDEWESVSSQCPDRVWVIQDRIQMSKPNSSRFAEAAERALHYGKGVVRVRLANKPTSEERAYANRWHDPATGLDYREPTPALFSFNNPLGACPKCRGFGRVIDLDPDLIIPDQRLSLEKGAVKPWQSQSFSECRRDALKHFKKRGIPTDKPVGQLNAEDRRFLFEGEMAEGKTLEQIWRSGGWYGIAGFFRWLETKTYKMHVRVLLSKYRAYRECGDCGGRRFQPETLLHYIETDQGEYTIADINRLSLEVALKLFQHFTPHDDDPATRHLLNEIVTRLTYLCDVGLSYLTLDRSTRTLSGGEIERVNLTSCLGNSLVNTLFVMDEPSIGLHPRDTSQLITVLQRLRDRGNTVVVVEHEESVIRAADYLLDLGPGRGEKGGEIVYAGPPAGILNKKTLTSDYLSGRKSIPTPKTRRAPNWKHSLRLKGSTLHNLKKPDVRIPLGRFVAVTGVSGSGKSTLVHEALVPVLERAVRGGVEPNLSGSEGVSQVIRVDQSPLTKTPRSNAALYLGIFDDIRALFASSDEAQAQGATAGLFSFNSSSGRCDRCSGMGAEKIEMQFLADVFVVCPVCQGRRYKPFVLAMHYNGKSIDEVLKLTVNEAIDFFNPEKFTGTEARLCLKIQTALRWLASVGLEYLQLGQPLHQLSGGEAQRLKLLRYLHGFKPAGESSEDSGDEDSCLDADQPNKTTPNKSRVFILDEPTTGLHFEDIRLLMEVFQTMVNAGDSLIVIEHNMEVVQVADWVIDLGPEGGDRGGELVGEGTPEQLAKHPTSHTGRYLRQRLEGDRSSLKLREEPPRAIAPTQIEVRGARHHNLKNISVDIQLGDMTVLTGLSGSGKSTLAFDLLFSEGQRRYLDSLNAYARQFVEQMERPAVDRISNVPPTVAIEQRMTQGGAKSTVATVTEIHQFIRLLYSKLGDVHDPETGEKAIRQTVDEVVEQVMKAARLKPVRLLAPLIQARKGIHVEIAKWANRKGYPWLRVDGRWVKPTQFKALSRFQEHTIEVMTGEVGRSTPRKELTTLVDETLRLGKGSMRSVDAKERDQVFSLEWHCPSSGRSFEALDPRLFSFHSTHGWCSTCQGFGSVRDIKVEADSLLEEELAIEKLREDEGEETLCPDCGGVRLNPIARAVRLPMLECVSKSVATIGDIGRLSISEAKKLFSKLKPKGRDAVIARDVLPEIVQRLAFLESVGLGYLTLDRAANTLSGGESQRIRLAAQLGSNLQGVLYVLDEPTIGLHPRDNDRLLTSLQALKKNGNTLVIVEHDEETMRRSDRIIDLGPGAGTHGGNIVASGTWKDLARQGDSVTGRLLGSPMKHPMRGERRKPASWLTIEGATKWHIDNQTVKIPHAAVTVLCGVSGAGKSTLLHEIIRPAINSTLPKSPRLHCAKTWKKISGANSLSGVVEVDPSPIGKTSRSTPATYLGLMDTLRNLFAMTPLAKSRGYGPGRFSYNAGSGRCEACLGQGDLRIEMSFLPTFSMPCESCGGKRYNRETLEITYKDKSIADVLGMTFEEARGFFEGLPDLRRPLELICDIGLGYLTLGQRSPTLSGGEAQRLKLAYQLAESLKTRERVQLRSRKPAPNYIYLLEEPTIGLHLADVERLLKLLHRLADDGHTVVVIEHHGDVVAEADWVIEMGPGGGDAGGKIISTGTPEKIAKLKSSPTAPYIQL